MIIYRIEHSDGIGPYINDLVFDITGINYINWCKESHNNNKRTPAPHIDINGISMVNSDLYIYGFKNKSQLMSWFLKEELINLDNMGFKVAIYNCDEFLTGDKQVAFIKDKSKLMTKFAIHRLFDKQSGQDKTVLELASRLHYYKSRGK